MSDEAAKEAGQAIAIIGMSARFPGAKNVARFWQNLRDGVECISFFTHEEMLAAGVDPSLLNDSNYVNADGVLEDIDLFDASFFGFNPREAEVLDPQHRFFLECSWEALESAGYDPETYQGLIGVYAGTSLSTYQDNLYSNPELVGLVGDFQIAIGNNKDHLTTQVSYKLNLKGPSVAVQTACSTSLVSVCLACQSLLSYECDLALAGGVTIGVPQRTGYLYQAGGIGSPDGHCRAFDAAAQGTVGGSGVGLVVLKRLDDALADGDYIHAVIRGAALNNDGSLKVGYTAPSVVGQAKVIAMAQAIAGVEPESIGYVEAHGTGTPLGDPIEIAALTQAFRARTTKKQFCAIGSVKTNIGHLDSAAGVAGLIKTVLALKHKMLPPSLHFTEPNPNIDFANSPFYVNATLKEWQANGSPRRAGVSSFGIGGTNAHVVVEEAPQTEEAAPSRPAQLIVLSARTSSALDRATINLAEHLRQHPETNLADLAFTLQAGRRAFKHRRTLACESHVDAIEALETPNHKRVLTAIVDAEHRPVAFMFPGQGAQYACMAAGLYESEADFREQIDLCSELLKPHLDTDLRHLLYPSAEQREKANQQLQQTAYAQPALFAVEYALAGVWMKWGVRPEAMIGHSLGEYVAACLAGVFSLEEALELVAARGRLMQRLPAGAMLAVALAEQLLVPLLSEELSLAAVNGQALCVVSGTFEALGQLEARLKEEGIYCQHLHTSHAFHSRMMEPILQEFEELVGKVNLNPPSIPYLSNLTGTWATATDATDPGYWAQHLRQAVRFFDGLRPLLADPYQILLEVGPGHTLSNLARQHSERNPSQLVVSSLPHPRDEQPDERYLLDALGRLWLRGIEINWSGFYERERRSRLPLPTYPFERERYWIERQKESEAEIPSSALRKKQDVADWFYVPSWKRSLSPKLPPPESLAGRKLSWLIFSDVSGVAATVASYLKSASQDVSIVKAGERYVRLGESEYAIDPRERESYDALLYELQKLDQLPDRILHFWSVTGEDETEPEEEFFERCQERGIYSLLFLAQALEKQHLSDRLQIEVISNRLQKVTGEEALSPEKATVLGPCKVIPQEYPHISCRSIDILWPAVEAEAKEKLLRQLTAEIVAEAADAVVAYRGNQRWVQTFEPIHLEEANRSLAPLRQQGVYLITGGLGGVGLVLAEHLAQTIQAKLVLVGRSAFPARAEWANWLATHGEDDEVSRKIVILQSIEEAGAEVLILSADVADAEQMRAVLAQTRERFGTPNGVIHGAGATVADAFQLIQGSDRALCEQHFHPKAHGLLTLEKVLSDVDLDFCLLLSSLSSVLGGLGFVAYAAANIFMDAYVDKRSQTNPANWVSVNWDGWKLWEDDEEDAPAANSGLNDLEILPDEGAEAFQRLLSLGCAPQVVVSTGDLQARIAEWVRLESLRETTAAPQRDLATALHARPVLSSPFVAPRNETEQAVSDIWQSLLGVSQVGIQDNFFELGGHSLLATQIVSKARVAFGVELPLRNLFETPSIIGLAEKIEQSMSRGDTFIAPSIRRQPRERYRGNLSPSGVLEISQELRRQVSEMSSDGPGLKT
ncbi:MAG TPA: beta-ketoacyl synthase N-terminal-like domain-containing protein [Pyrinomonadaceae bacterium]|jgi:acyl transferase domain-containing protein/acyl carrier protein